ncbi:MAG: hypothetical protein CMH34_02895 [Microbacterium sp.]|nr:hypothetical protein [Microbacterium sp.]
MPLIDSFRYRRSEPRRGRRALLVVAATLALSLAIAGGSSLATATPAVAADGDPVGQTLWLRNGLGQDAYNVSITEADPAADDGTVLIRQGNGSCLSARWDFRTPDGFIRDHIDQPCNTADVTQRFFLVPFEEAPRPDAATPSPVFDHNAFYIVSEYNGQCFYSDANGLHGHGNYEALDPTYGLHNHPARGFNECGTDYYHRQNATGNEITAGVNVHTGAQFWVIINDRKDSATGNWTEFEHVLHLASSAATHRCAENTLRCAVRNDATDGWLPPNDSAVRASGSVEIRAAGCGAPVDSDSVTRRHNDGEKDETITKSSTITISNSSTVSDKTTVGGKISISGGTGKDAPAAFNAGGEFSISHEGAIATTRTTATATSESVTYTVPPQRYFMLTWTQTVYVIDAEWSLGREFTHLFGGSGWELPISSVMPLSIDGASPLVPSNVVTKTQKECAAGPASTVATPPTISASAACDAGLPEPAVGAVLHACPGTWSIPAPAGQGTDDPVYEYQWYYEDSDGVQRDATPWSTANATFTLKESSFITLHHSLGVRVRELGDPYRLESEPAESSNELALHPGAVGDSATGDGSDEHGDSGSAGDDDASHVKDTAAPTDHAEVDALPATGADGTESARLLALGTALLLAGGALVYARKRASHS